MLLSIRIPKIRFFIIYVRQLGFPTFVSPWFHRQCCLSTRRVPNQVNRLASWPELTFRYLSKGSVEAQVPHPRVKTPKTSKKPENLEPVSGTSLCSCCFSRCLLTSSAPRAAPKCLPLLLPLRPPSPSPSGSRKSERRRSLPLLYWRRKTGRFMVWQKWTERGGEGGGGAAGGGTEGGGEREEVGGMPEDRRFRKSERERRGRSRR